jgi:hypothetical protein
MEIMKTKNMWRNLNRKNGNKNKKCNLKWPKIKK